LTAIPIACPGVDASAAGTRIINDNANSDNINKRRISVLLLGSNKHYLLLITYTRKHLDQAKFERF
jgi:hypothetical protein